jgi:hypothetical protein
MPYCVVGTHEYKDIGRQLARRLDCALTGYKLRQYEHDGYSFFEIECKRSQEAELRRALALLLLRNLQYDELIKAITKDYKMLSLEDKRSLLVSCVKTARSLERIDPLARKLEEHLDGGSELILEGFLRFSMKDTVSLWRRIVERGAQELVLRREYREFVQLMQKIAEIQPGYTGEVHLHINDDGYKLCDTAGYVLERGTCDSLVGLLIGLSPDKIVVHGAQGARDTQLIDIIGSVFAGKVFFS